jgi:ketosteroid isomerase-like protein
VHPEEVVRAFKDAFNAGDVDRMEALCTDEAEIVGIRSALEETSYSGPDAARSFWADSAEVWSELRIDIQELTTKEDTVIGRGIFRARGRESGVEVEQLIGVRFHVEGDRLASVRTYVDPEEAG